MCTACSRMRTDPTHAPAMRLLHVRTDEQQHARPALPRLSTLENTRTLPACSRSTTWSFFMTSMLNSPTIATDVRSADASRPVLPSSPHPAAAAAVPAQQTLARALPAQQRDRAPQNLRCDPAKLATCRKTCRVPYPYPRTAIRFRKKG